MNGLRLSVHHALAISLFYISCFIGFSALPSQVAASSSESGSYDWHYTIRPADTLPLIASRLLKEKHAWTEIAHYNHIKDVSALQVGSIIKLPISWLKHQPRPAKISSFSGDVMLKRHQDSRYQPISTYNELYVGDEVMTREGRVLIEFADSSSLRLDPFSHIILNKLTRFEEVGMVDTRMRLNRGGLRTKVNPLTRGSRYEISTPSAVAAVRGTDYRLRTNEHGSAIEVIEGSVEFRHQHGSQVINGGQGARKHINSAQLELIDLETLPTLTKLPNVPDRRNEQGLEWQGLPSDLLALNMLPNEQDSAKSSSQYASEQTLASLTEGVKPKASVEDALSSVPADPAKLELPIPGSIIDAFTAEFTWSVSNDQTLSRIEIARSSDFSRLAIPTNWSEQTAFRLKQQIPAGNYFWRVRTLSSGKAESVSATRSVSIQGKLDDVSILTVNYVGDQVGIFWHTVDNAKGYVLQVSDDNAFRRLLKEETLSKTRAFLKLPEGKRFYARVKGLGDEVYSSEFGPQKEILVESKPE